MLFFLYLTTGDAVATIPVLDGGKGSGASRKKKRRRDSLYPDDVLKDDVLKSGVTPQEIVTNNEVQADKVPQKISQEVVLVARKELSGIDLSSINLIKLPGEKQNLYKHSVFIKGKEYDLEKIVLLLLD